jgi:16S rRNA C967 or C1407 C5-methylase (RsmB/RsmF family)
VTQSNTIHFFPQPNQLLESTTTLLDLNKQNSVAPHLKTKHLTGRPHTTYIMINALMDNSINPKEEEEDFFGAKKKKRKRSSNPLAQARGKLKSHENIWFRRTGVGYHLFVEYYANQPNGTVVQFDRLERSSYTSTTTSNANVVRSNEAKTSKEVVIPAKGGAATGKGESRASKRRKMKQQRKENLQGNEKFPTSETTKEEEKVVVVPKIVTHLQQQEQQYSLPSIDESMIARHPLWHAFSLKQQQEQKRRTSASTSSMLIFLRPFIAALSQPLPLTFRIRRSVLPDQIQNLQRQIMSSDFGGTTNLVFPLAFGDNFIYQATTSALSKETLSKISPSLKEFLVHHCLDGSLARQELGSMLPVLALEKMGAFAAAPSIGTKTTNKKKPTCRVLDLCASPGSKTLQALELFFHAEEEEKKKKDASSTRQLQGRVVANDVSESRLESLQGVVQRSGLPSHLLDAKHLSFTCQDARHWTRNGSSSNNTNNNNNNTTLTKKKVKPWQAIICDVPCSGDGTVRKDGKVLPMWKPDIGNALHALQLAILKQALHLVDVGGVVCYSTCSLNPVEDEAVVLAALAHYNNNKNDKHSPKKPKAKHSSSHPRGNDSDDDKNEDHGKGGNMDHDLQQPVIELVDFPTLPGFIRRPGISTWKVADFSTEGNASSTNMDTVNKNNGDNSDSGHYIDDHEEEEENDNEIPHLQWYRTYEDAVAAKMEHALPSLWPVSFYSSTNPTNGNTGKNNGQDKNSIQSYHLERCTRLWPQDHNSGGFFVALLRKNR